MGNSVEDLLGVLDFDPFSTVPKLAADLPSVHEPELAVGLLGLVGEHLEVLCGVVSKETLTETGTESEICDFCPLLRYNPRAVPVKEVVAGLLPRQLSDRWENTECIIRQEDDVFR